MAKAKEDVTPTAPALSAVTPGSGAVGGDVLPEFDVSLAHCKTLRVAAKDATTAYADYCQQMGITGSKHLPIVVQVTGLEAGG